MLTNQTFLTKILESFKDFINVGTSRSTAKLKPLHGAIAKDIAERLGTKYLVKSQGYGDDKEGTINGRYIDKKVDITICDRASKKPIAGIAVKFVMQNYSQNSNNYFENMLGETANIRCSHCPYFQIFIILDELPYYKSDGNRSKWENFTDHNFDKYVYLSEDDVDRFLHTPNKTLIYAVHINPSATSNPSVTTKEKYLDFYKKNNPSISLSLHPYPLRKPNGTVIINDYVLFIDKVYHTIMSL